MPNVNITKRFQRGSFDDPLTEILRDGTRSLLTQAVESEMLVPFNFFRVPKISLWHVDAQKLVTAVFRNDQPERDFEHAQDLRLGFGQRIALAIGTHIDSLSGTARV